MDPFDLVRNLNEESLPAFGYTLLNNTYYFEDFYIQFTTYTNATPTLTLNPDICFGIKRHNSRVQIFVEKPIYDKADQYQDQVEYQLSGDNNYSRNTDNRPTPVTLLLLELYKELDRITDN
jgi:hypothetical protein